MIALAAVQQAIRMKEGLATDLCAYLRRTPDWDVLLAVYEHELRTGTPMLLRGLRAALGVSDQRISQTVRRLHDRRVLRRGVYPGTKSTVMVETTEAARKAIEKWATAIAEEAAL